MTYKFNITWRFVLGFLALMFALGEMHELVHTNVGYLFGGCYGERDFNVWGLCDASGAHPYSYWSTLAGPIFSFLVLWLAYFMLRRAESLPAKARALALLFASFPFARIFTVLAGGGDEYLVARNLYTEGARDNTVWAIVAAIILAICLPPLVAGYRALPERRKWLSFPALFIGPIFILIPVLLIALNGMLTSGVLAGPGLLGAPLMITLWFALCVGAAYWLRGSFSGWLEDDDEKS